MFAVASCSADALKLSLVKTYARRVAPDLDKIVYVSIDTVTYADNLEYRIESLRREIQFDSLEIVHQKFNLVYSSLRESAEKRIKELEQKMAKNKAFINSLDSLGKAHSDIMFTAVAYTYDIQYNYVGNFVWVQIDSQNNLLKATKDPMEVLLNPGGDVPGYMDLVLNYSK